MSYFPKSVLGRVLFSLWLLACIFVLLVGLGQPLLLVFGMFFLTAPLSTVLIAVIEFLEGNLMQVSSLDKLDQYALNASLIWFEGVVGGYIQWFVLIPWLWSKFMKLRNRK